MRINQSISSVLDCVITLDFLIHLTRAQRNDITVLYKPGFLCDPNVYWLQTFVIDEHAEAGNARGNENFSRVPYGAACWNE